MYLNGGMNMGKALKNEVKVRRLQNQIDVLLKSIKETEEPEKITKYMNEIKNRKIAIKYIKELETPISFDELKKRFNVKSYW
jgi:translation initiation factor 2 alpha subunit (eIF-2alpha)